MASDETLMATTRECLNINEDTHIHKLKEANEALWVELKAQDKQPNAASRAAHNLKQVEDIDNMWGEDFGHELDSWRQQQR